MKKNILKILTAVMCIAFFLTSGLAFAQEVSSQNPSDAYVLSARIGENSDAELVEVIVSLEQNPKLAALSFSLEYNDDAYSLENVEVCQLQDHVGEFSEALSVNPYYCSWVVMGTTPEAYTDATGDLVKFTFAVTDAEPETVYAFNILNVSAGYTEKTEDGGYAARKAVFSTNSASYTTPAAPSGVNITGQVKSYNPNNPVKIALYDSADTGYTEALYTAEIAAGTGSGQTTHGFEITGVAPGTYDLVVSKAAHLDYILKSIPVGEQNLDLTACTNASISTMTMLAGDVDGSGSINVDDLNLVWNGKNYNKSASTEGVNKLTDIDGTGSINVDDLNIVWNGKHYNKGVSACAFNYVA